MTTKTTTNDLHTVLAAFPLRRGTAPNAQYGINVMGDVLVNQSTDGVDLNKV
jgi:hypothetical protein